jgi:hypothetical protein
MEAKAIHDDHSHSDPTHQAEQDATRYGGDSNATSRNVIENDGYENQDSTTSNQVPVKWHRLKKIHGVCPLSKEGENIWEVCYSLGSYGTT